MTAIFLNDLAKTCQGCSNVQATLLANFMVLGATISIKEKMYG